MNKNKKQKLEYSLNAILYCMWKNEIQKTKIIEKVILGIILLGLSIISRKYKDKYDLWLNKHNDINNKYLYTSQKGFYIYLSGNRYNPLLYFIPISIGIVALSLLIKILNNNVSKGINYDSQIFIIVFIFGTVITLTNNIIFKTVFYNENYIKYYKIFSKESKQWHRKWFRRTNWFIAGGIFSIILGIASMFAILIYL